jgi:hypothetical protein
MPKVIYYSNLIDISKLMISAIILSFSSPLSIALLTLKETY